MLQSIISLDKAYLDIPKHGKKCGCGTELEKAAGAVSKNEDDHPLFPLKVIPDVTVTTLQNVVNFWIQSDLIIECNGHRSYPNLENASIGAPTKSVISNWFMTRLVISSCFCLEPIMEAAATISLT